MNDPVRLSSDLLALSFDGQASPYVGLTGERDQQPSLLSSTWGLAWYPDNQKAVARLREMDVPRGTSLALYLEDTVQFRSSLFLGSAQGVGISPSSLATTSTPATASPETAEQPFVRSYAGRQWLLNCAGELSSDLKQELKLGDDAFDVAPVGSSLAEHALSWLLANMRARSARTIDEFGWRETHSLLRRLNQFGGVSFLLSDGNDLVAYRDESGTTPFHWARMVPPHEQPHLGGRSFSITLDTAMDASRTLFAFSTLPMRGARWTPMEDGEMRVARRGTSVWSSHPAGIEEHIFSHLGYPRMDPSPVEPVASDVQFQQQVGQAALGEPSNVQGQVAGEAAALPALSTPVSPEPPLTAPTPPLASTPQKASESAPHSAVRVVSGRGAGEEASAAASESDASSASPANIQGPAAEEAILSVVHTTTYRYANPVERSSHRFCLTPVHDNRQVVLEQSLDISVDGASRDFEDVFGNRARVLEVQSPFSEMKITSRSRSRVKGVSASQLQWPYERNQLPLVWMPWQRQMMHAYLLPPELPEPELRELSEFGMSFAVRNDHDLVETLLDLNRSIYRDFQYVPGSTTVETTPYAVYKSRKGVCQDFANVLICIARLLGVPARYRVGYIYTGGSYENKIQSDASHAWAEVYLPVTGWFGFDPTNGCVAGSDHLRVACGRQFGDAAPTAGTIYRGGGQETLSVDVRVERTEVENSVDSTD